MRMERMREYRAATDRMGDKHDLNAKREALAKLVELLRQVAVAIAAPSGAQNTAIIRSCEPT
jgi:hypothetical protein